MPIGGFSINLNGVMTDLGKTNNAAATMTFNMSFAKTTQFGSSFAVNSLTQDGYAAGHLASVRSARTG